MIKNNVVEIKDIEQVFLLILQENSSKDEIEKKLRYFKDKDWQALYGFIARCGLFPVFYSRLLNLNLKIIPPGFLFKLKNIYFLNLKRNLLLEKELLKILSYFEKLNIAVIPLKGPILARYFYNDLGLRQASCDLDLLVRHETIDETKEKLAELDYRVCGIEHKRDFLFPANLSKQVSQIMFVKDIDTALSINLDLHWYIRGFFLDTHIQKLWQEARYFDFDGQKILLLSNEDNLLYLSIISISTLEFVRLRYIYDIHRLVTFFGKELDWDKLIYKAKHSNLENCLYFPLKLSTVLFSTNIPENFLNEIKPDWIIRRLISVWINKKNILDFRQKIQFSYPLRYLLGRYLYSSSLNDFVRKSFRRILGRHKSAALDFTD